MSIASKNPLCNASAYVKSDYNDSGLKYARVPLFWYTNDRDITIPIQIKQLLSTLPKGTFLAGGAIAAWICDQPKLATDIDIFFHDQQVHDKVVGLLSVTHNELFGSQVPYGTRMFENRTPSEDGWNQPIQAIDIAWYRNVEHLIDGFDWTACQFGIDIQPLDCQLVYNPVSPLDYLFRRLVQHRNADDIHFEKRLRKYLSKSFRTVGDTTMRANRLLARSL